MKHVQRKKGEEEEKKGDVPQNQVHQAISSFCLDYKGKKRTREGLREKSTHMSGLATRKSKVYKRRSRIRSNLLSAQQQTQGEGLSFSYCLMFCWKGEHL